MQLARTVSSCSRASVARPRPSASRVASVVRAAPEGSSPASDSGAPVPPGTIFYGGKSYTEAEYELARERGELVQLAAPTTGLPGVGYTSSGVAALPSFGEVMGFSGAPEIVNGRLAMLGFVAAVGAELTSGEGVLKQLTEEPTGIAVAFLLIIAGSLVPAFLGGSKDKALGPLTPGAELINGRGAMIGFAAMLAIEAVKGSALF